MITGPCPYCDALNLTLLPEDGQPLPAYGQRKCDTCDRTYWLRLSMFAPVAWTLEAFDREFAIDHANGTIRERTPPPPLSEEAQALFKFASRVAGQQVAMEICHGSDRSLWPASAKQEVADTFRKRLAEYIAAAKAAPED